MLLYYVRHGSPIYNPDSLTPLGHRQAEAVGRRLALHGIDRVFVSSSVRAQQTAQPLCELLRKEPTVLDWTNESYAWRDMCCPRDDGKGDFWGWGVPSMRAKLLSPEVAALGANWFDHPFFAGTRFREGILRVRRETDAFLASLGYEHDHARGVYRAVRPHAERIALFAHEGFGKLFLSELLDVPYPLFSTRFELAHTGLSIIEFPDEGDMTVPRVLQHSSDAHIYAEGLPTKFQDRIYL